MVWGYCARYGKKKLYKCSKRLFQIVKQNALSDSKQLAWEDKEKHGYLKTIGIKLIWKSKLFHWNVLKRLKLPNCLEAEGSVVDFEVADDPEVDVVVVEDEVLLFWEPDEADVGVAVAE